MANRPVRNRSTKSTKHKMTQTEINRVKPVGVLSLDLLEKEAQKIISINVRFPDGQIYKFFHIPMSVGDGEALVKTVTEQSKIEGLHKLLADLVVNEDGSPFATYEQWTEVPIAILTCLNDAISESTKSEPGED